MTKYIEEKKRILNVVGNNLKSWRGVRGYSKKRVADMAGIIPQQYNDYESGKTEPGIITAQRVCDALGISLFDLMQGTELTNEIPMEGTQEEIDYIKNKLTKLGFTVDYGKDDKLVVFVGESIPCMEFTVYELKNILKKINTNKMKSVQYQLVLLGIMDLVTLKNRLKNRVGV